MIYPIDRNAIDVVPARIARAEARAYVSYVRSILVERVKILACAAGIGGMSLQSECSWEAISAFAIVHCSPRRLTPDEVESRRRRAQSQLGALGAMVSFEQLLEATGGLPDDAEPTELMRQIGFDIACASAYAVTQAIPHLRWGIARTKRIDHPDFHQPAITGFAMRSLEFMPFVGYESACGWEKANRSKRPLWNLVSHWIANPGTV